MEFGGKNKIIVILGPTSSGKSEVAIRLAKKFNGEIISADSRQVYRGMDVGTGKIERDSKSPSPARRGRGEGKSATYLSHGIPHHLVDIVSPKTEYNVSKFKKDANYVINYVIKKGKLPIICGGTGFWIKSVVDDIDFPQVKPNKKLREVLEKKSAQDLFEMLKKLDPERARDIDAKNKVRLIRAIEICKALGKVPKLNQESKIMNYEFLQIGIKITKEKLHKNIKKRLEKRFSAGMIEEVEKLHKSGLSWKKIQSFGLAYYWIPIYLQKKPYTNSCLGKKLCTVLNREGLFEKTYQTEKDYAKRQMTWFRKDNRIIWIKNYKEIEKTTKNFLNE